MAHSLARSAGTTVDEQRGSHKGGLSEPGGPRPIRDLIDRLALRFGGFSIASRAERAAREASLADALASEAIWRARAKAFASHVETLEQRVQESQRVVTDLRARLVCMHGKLASTAATARYQRFTTALEGRKPDP